MNLERGSLKSARLTIVLAGVVLGQALLYGPSLLGLKVLLPLDTLAEPGIYLPKTPEFAGVVPHSTPLSDLVCMDEPSRRFATREFEAGRLPMWTPYQYGGAPMIWPRFSPFRLMEWFIESPVVLAWTQLWAAIVAGLGAYLFCRRALEVSFWPAAIAGWCYPLTGFFALWQGYIICLAAYWLPWILLAVEREVRPSSVAPVLRSSTAEGGLRRVESPPVLRSTAEGGKSEVRPVRGGAPLGLSATTCLVLISGQVDVGAQVLLVSGLYALWRLWTRRNRRKEAQPECGMRSAQCAVASTVADSKIPQSAIRNPQSYWGLLTSAPAVKLVGGWTLGVLLAAPAFLPVIDYTRSSARLARRSAGSEERPPVGISALPQVVLPNMYGGATGKCVPLVAETQLESSAGAYTGLLATLAVAPLAWRSRRHRSLNLFWTVLAFLGVAWCLNVPGLVHLMRLPGLNMLSYNRLVFATSFALLALMATGLEALNQRSAQWRWWCWLPVGVLAALFLWCLYRAMVLPDMIGLHLEQLVSGGQPVGWVRDLPAVRQVQSWFSTQYAVAAALCAAGFVFWFSLRFARALPSRLLPPMALLLVGELLWFGYSRTVQCSPALYYPRIPVLDQIAKAAPGRMIGFDCLPANLGSVCGLDDVRGYDAVDPVRMVELVQTAARTEERPAYAAIQSMTPKAAYVPGGDILLPPVLDMLGVRYVIFRGSPPPNARPAFQSPDYWVLTNAAALPRAYVPRRVEVLTNSAARLEQLASPNFDPREVAYVESPVNLPGPCVGGAEIMTEVPTRIIVSVTMETAGLVVLADRWDKGWRAYLNGKRVPILRTNHAIRGVEVPPGESRLEFRYEPQSFAWGLRLAGAAALVLLAWVAVPARSGRQTRSPGPPGPTET